MIHDTLPHASTYRSLGPLFAQGLDYLASFNPATPDGKYPLLASDLFALVQSYETKPAQGRKFESHLTYADIQFIVSGREIIHYAPLSTLRLVDPYNPDKDVMFHEGPLHYPLAMSTGDFAIFWPHDGHLPGCIWAEPQPIRKVVLKVRLPG